jgi:hypothetical protein
VPQTLSEVVRLKSSATGLVIYHGDGNSVGAIEESLASTVRSSWWEEHEANEPGQFWVRLRNVASGSMLDSNAEGEVYCIPPNYGDHQRWYVLDRGRYINVATGLALDGNANKQIYTMEPNDGDYQGWVRLGQGDYPP